jgi:phosphate transport system permease protein
VAAAIYLEEFAPRNRWTDLIEVNINNLAAVPSIVFGLLGLAVFLNFFGCRARRRWSAGLVLTLLTLPTIIIAGARGARRRCRPRSARRPSAWAPRRCRVLHHVLPLAMPGMLTGTIIGMARALGETAPLLMIGMVAFIVDVPRQHHRPGHRAAGPDLPLGRQPGAGVRVAKTSAAILVLLGFS